MDLDDIEEGTLVFAEGNDGETYPAIVAVDDDGGKFLRPYREHENED
jgi:hypothetical protein